MTATDGDEAHRLAETLVEKRLAACVQIIPRISSIFRWQGSVTHANEVLLIAKTVKSKFAELEDAVRAIHSYDTPEIVAVDLTAGSRPYLDWLNATVGKNPEF